MQKFSVKCEVRLINQLTVALRAANDESDRIALGVEHAEERTGEAWGRVRVAREAVRVAKLQLSDLSKAARGDASVAALLSPLEEFMLLAEGELEGAEAEFQAEGAIKASLMGRAATNRLLVSALATALEACELEGAESSPVDDTNGWSSRW